MSYPMFGCQPSMLCGPFCQLATQVISNQQIGVPATNIAMDNPHPFLVYTIKIRWMFHGYASLLEIIPSPRRATFRV